MSFANTGLIFTDKPYGVIRLLVEPNDSCEIVIELVLYFSFFFNSLEVLYTNPSVPGCVCKKNSCYYSQN